MLLSRLRFLAQRRLSGFSSCSEVALLLLLLFIFLLLVCVFWLRCLCTDVEHCHRGQKPFLCAVQLQQELCHRSITEVKTWNCVFFVGAGRCSPCEVVRNPDVHAVAMGSRHTCAVQRKLLRWRPVFRLNRRAAGARGRCLRLRLAPGVLCGQLRQSARHGRCRCRARGSSVGRTPG